MANMKEILEAKLDRAIKEHGPDDPLARALKSQLASMGTVRHPSQLAAINSGQTDKFHGAALESSAPSDPMLPAMNAMEDWLRKEAEKYGGMAPDSPDQSPSEASTTPDNNEPT